MKILIYLLLLTCITQKVWCDIAYKGSETLTGPAVLAEPPKQETNFSPQHHIKRDASDQKGSSDEKAVSHQHFEQNVQPYIQYNRDVPYLTAQYVGSAATPQVVYARPATGIQQAAAAYRTIPIYSTQVASTYTVTPQPVGGGGFRFSRPVTVQQHQQPLDIAYAQPASPVQYAFAIPAPVGYGGSVANGYQLPSPPFGYISASHGTQGLQIALSQTASGRYNTGVPQIAYVSHPGPVGIKYAQKLPGAALSPQPIYQTQPSYTYSIQPSIQIASAKQIVAAPSVATQQYRTLAPISHNNDATDNFAAYSQYLATAPAKEAVQYSQSSYAGPTGSEGASIALKPAQYAVAGHSPIYTIAQNNAIYSNNGALHYGTHLYQPVGIGGAHKIVSNGKYYQ